MSAESIENKVLKAPEFEVKNWVDAEGNKNEEIKLADFKGKFKVMYCFQSWCPGCHIEYLGHKRGLSWQY